MFEEYLLTVQRTTQRLPIFCLLVTMQTNLQGVPTFPLNKHKSPFWSYHQSGFKKDEHSAETLNS